MKKIILTSFCTLLISASALAQWQPVGNKIKTSWAEDIDPAQVLSEYPRPIMERADWKNLNGLWKYSVTPINKVPVSFTGQILVPFAIESSLSGVGRRLSDSEELWYQKEFNVPANWKDKRVLLHFGAVDWKADIWVNDIKVGEHTGGYTPFSFDITAALDGKGNNQLKVKVWDPTDKGYQPRGKQIGTPDGIWYTPVSGIWQTVWLEPVSDIYITNIKTTPDIDNNRIRVEVDTNQFSTSELAQVEVYDGKVLVAEGKAINGKAIDISMPENSKLWSPSSPFLYSMKVSLFSKGKKSDSVKSYTAMRKYSAKRDADGIVRLQLNNQNLFQFGPLDQGWWPDGLYTAPSDEALVYDIKKTKELGYNMIRKHIKVEPARWYTYCDKLGMIVWQDMPSGDNSPQWQNRTYFNGTELKRSVESEANYKKEWKEVIDYLYSYPCIGTWVPFNEAWGQFNTTDIAEWTKRYDPSRIVNPASGGNHYTCGDILDLHNYPGPEMYLYDAQRVNVLGEYGGIGMVLKGHIWEPDRNWGYVQFNNAEEVTKEYVKYAGELLQLIKRGFSAAVYTQTTDVEIEVNGLMTYDRKVLKINADEVRKINVEICNSLNK